MPSGKTARNHRNGGRRSHEMTAGQVVPDRRCARARQGTAQPATVSRSPSWYRGAKPGSTRRTMTSTIARRSWETVRGPRPWTSTNPSIGRGADARRRPLRASISVRSSATRAAYRPADLHRSMSASASVDFPAPESPAIRMPRSPSSTVVACSCSGATDQASAGSVTMNRAPLTSPGLAPAMFSAVSLPPCASTICRLIDRPKPEFWPKASPAGRSV